MKFFFLFAQPLKEYKLKMLLVKIEKISNNFFDHGFNSFSAKSSKLLILKFDKKKKKI